MRFYLDTNFFIEAIEGAGTAREACLSLLDCGEDRPGLLATSLLTLSEVLVHPLRFSDPDLAGIYQDLITDSGRMNVAVIERAILVEAASIRANGHTTKLPDAIHLATACALDCSHVISDDQKLLAMAQTLGIAGIGLGAVQQLMSTLDTTP